MFRQSYISFVKNQNIKLTQQSTVVGSDGKRRLTTHTLSSSALTKPSARRIQAHTLLRRLPSIKDGGILTKINNAGLC